MNERRRGHGGSKYNARLGAWDDRSFEVGLGYLAALFCFQQLLDTPRYGYARIECRRVVVLQPLTDYIIQ